MQKSLPYMRVLWPLDAMGAGEETNKKTESLINALAKKIRITVQPVYVCLDENVRGLIEKSLSRFLSDRKRTLSKYAKLEPLCILTPPFEFISDTSVLLDHIRKTKPDLIVASTFYHSGYGRLVCGSFVESLILQTDLTKTPVLVVGPRASPQESFDRLVLATNFSKMCDTAFDQVLDLCELIQLKLTLYACQALRDSSLERFGKKDWMSKAESRGLGARLHFEKTAQYASQAICAFAESQRKGVLAVITRSTPSFPRLAESVSRQVLESVSLPLLVFHSQS